MMGNLQIINNFFVSKYWKIMLMNVKLIIAQYVLIYITEYFTRGERTNE